MFLLNPRLLLVALAFLFSSFLNAAVPLVLEYSGRVSSSGSPFTGSGSFRFAFIDSTATSTYWSNDGTSTAGSEPSSAVTVTVDDGFYSVCLGDDSVTNMTVIAESVFQNDDLYLRVWFDDGSAGSQLLLPDQRVVPAAFAIRAREADAVADGAITEAMLSPGLLNKLLGATSSNAPTGMATVAAGSFAMGEAAGSYDRSPSREITLAEFFIDTHEVDKDTWDTTYTWAIANGYDFDNAGSAAASTHPVCQLNWYDIVKWCNARSEQDGLTPAYYTNQYLSTIYRTGQEDLISTSVKWDADGYRLPTEAEWEKAARGGLSAKTYPWGDTIETSFANYNGSGDDFEAVALPRTTPVGHYNGNQLPAGSDMANGLGLYDVAGNISEWVWDRYQRDLYKDETATTTDPHGPDTGTSRVLRGGSWGSASTMLGCAIRDFGQTDNVSYSGFRCVRSEK